MSRLWKFSALDTLFFRDGTPFNVEEGGQGHVTSHFPPYMTTLQGAIRTTLALGQGWSPDNPCSWPVELGTPDDLGQLILRGPYLFKESEMLFPAPFSFLLKKEGEQTDYTLLRPGGEVECDLGKRRLPQITESLDGAKDPKGYWLKANSMARVLAGGIPESGDMEHQDVLWKTENRTGIKIDFKSRTAQESMLYSSRHIRPEQDIALGVIVSGVSENWHRQIPPMVRLGGEGRSVGIEVTESVRGLVKPPRIFTKEGKIYFTLVLITPGFFGEQTRAVIENGPSGVPGRCISATLDKISQVGGWDIKNKCPRPLQPVIPAGATWFFEADKTDSDKVQFLHEQCVGMKTEYGFGQVLIGSWGDEN